MVKNKHFLKSNSIYFWHQKSCFHSLKNGLNIIAQKQTARQINPLVKILYFLASSITWQPVFMPIKGKERSVFQDFRLFEISPKYGKMAIQF